MLCGLDRVYRFPYVKPSADTAYTEILTRTLEQCMAWQRYPTNAQENRNCIKIKTLKGNSCSLSWTCEMIARSLGLTPNDIIASRLANKQDELGENGSMPASRIICRFCQLSFISKQLWTDCGRSPKSVITARHNLYESRHNQF